MKLRKMTLNINGADRMFICDPEKDTLASVIRRLGLTGTKVGCGTGVCGSCTVMLNGKLVRSCTKKIGKIEEYSEVLTIVVDGKEIKVKAQDVQRHPYKPKLQHIDFVRA